jgi:hypothetical protein
MITGEAHAMAVTKLYRYLFIHFHIKTGLTHQDSDYFHLNKASPGIESGRLSHKDNGASKISNKAFGVHLQSKPPNFVAYMFFTVHAKVVGSSKISFNSSP